MFDRKYETDTCRSSPRVDACTKVTGEEKYAADYYPENMCWAGVKRAGVPHAVLKAVHVEQARAAPGIIAVLTYKDIPGSNREGIVKQDKPILADEKIRHCGDAVALVVAQNKDALTRALGLIAIDIELLPGIFDPEEALQDKAPLIHEDNPGGNLLREVSAGLGDAEKTMGECEIIVEGAFETPRQEHAFLETETGVAHTGEEGVLLMVASTQTPFRDRLEIAQALSLQPERIEVVAPYLGGGFGGKDGVTVQSLLGLAALHAGGRPVKMWWGREESFLAGVKRIPARMYYRLGARQDGTFHALQCTLYFNAGAYAGLCGEVMTLAVEHAGGAYRIPHTSIRGLCVYTNDPPGGPFRGFGVPQVTAAIEQMVDMLAARLNMDPLKIRMLNALKKGDRNCIGTTLTHSTGVIECLEALADQPAWKDRDIWKKSASPYKRRGVGLVCFSHAMGYPAAVPDYANAKIELTREGIIRVYSGVADMGQGNADACLQIAGKILMQGQSGMELVLPDTRKTLPSGSASASRCTYTYGNALVDAAKELKARIIGKAQQLAGEGKPVEFVLVPNGVRHKPTGRQFSLAAISALFDDLERVCVSKFTMPAAEEGLDRIYLGPHTIFSYGAHLTYVEIDELTGSAHVKTYLACTDAGKVLNQQVYEQQIQGGIAQGLGYALTENFTVDKGQIRTPNLATYIIPTSLDVPDMSSLPVEIGEETGPFGLKGVGEISVNGPLPAVANALTDALGIRIAHAPFTAEAILKASKSI